MRSLECRFTRQQIDELELGERPSERATAHLSLCAGCRDFRAERNELRQLVGSLEPVVAPADFEMRLRARIAREQAPSQRTVLRAPDSNSRAGGSSAFCHGRWNSGLGRAERY